MTRLLGSITICNLKCFVLFFWLWCILQYILNYLGRAHNSKQLQENYFQYVKIIHDIVSLCRHLLFYLILWSFVPWSRYLFALFIYTRKHAYFTAACFKYCFGTTSLTNKQLKIENKKFSAVFFLLITCQIKPKSSVKHFRIVLYTIRTNAGLKWLCPATYFKPFKTDMFTLRLVDCVVVRKCDVFLTPLSNALFYCKTIHVTVRVLHYGYPTEETAWKYLCISTATASFSVTAGFSLSLKVWPVREAMKNTFAFGSGMNEFFSNIAWPFQYTLLHKDSRACLIGNSLGLSVLFKDTLKIR